jgi:RecA/RadA recombinase
VESPSNEQKFADDFSSEEISNNTIILDLIETYVGNDVLEVFGDTGTGKSKLALHVAQEAIAAGRKVHYLDTERNLNEDDLKELKGCEYKYTPKLDEIDKYVRNLPKGDVVIIDSIGFPILTSFARLGVKQKGDALQKLIAIFGDLKVWAYDNNGFVLVTNQPESEFNKEPGHIFRPFGDKAQFAAKEIWKTEYVKRSDKETKSRIIAFRSRSAGYQTKIADMSITDSGVEVIA